MSLLLDSRLVEKSARNRTDTTATSGVFRGTDGSNPVPSSEESANYRFLNGGAASAECRNGNSGALPPIVIVLKKSGVRLTAKD